MDEDNAKKEKEKEYYQVVVYSIEGEKNIYNLKKMLFESLNIDIEKSQKMLDRGPFVIGKFDKIESEHWLNVLLKLEADAKLLKDNLCPLHPENASSGECAICRTNFCIKCKRKLGLKNICELCALDFDIEKEEGKRSVLPLYLGALAVIIIIMIFIFSRMDSDSDRSDLPVKSTEVVEVEEDGIEEETATPEASETSEITDEDEKTGGLGIIVDQDIAVTDLGQIGYSIYRNIHGVKEQTEFFTEKDLSFNFSVLLEIANTENSFEVSFFGPDGTVIKTVQKTTQIGEKEAEFELRRSEIKHKYDNDFVFAAYIASVKMNGQMIGNIPLLYNPSEEFVQNNLPGVPLLTELSPQDLSMLGNKEKGPWIIIFYDIESLSSIRLIQAARILSLNPGFLVKIYQMDAGRNKSTMVQLKINDFPATVLLVGNRVINITYGFTNSDEFVQSISVALNRYYGNN